MKRIIDNFSNDAGNYARFRPDSPDELFDFLFQHCSSFQVAWDCGTGNGQVAIRLAERFDSVYATDISEQQLAQAPRLANITYLCERAETTSIPDNSISLITVAQAIHWFDFERFYDEVRRVARTDAMIAVWTYGLLGINEAIDDVIDDLYHNLTHPFWDRERKWVDECYKTIPFPFRELPTPDFRIVKQMTADEVLGYLRTWSGARHYLKSVGTDAVSLVEPAFRAAWGDQDQHVVTWPVYLRAGFIS